MNIQEKLVEEFYEAVEKKERKKRVVIMKKMFTGVEVEIPCPKCGELNYNKTELMSLKEIGNVINCCNCGEKITYDLQLNIELEVEVKEA